MKASSKRSAERPAVRVHAYLAALPAGARRHVEALRVAIRAAAPGAAEAFGYGMPSFSFEGRAFLWYGAWKRHSGFYPLSRATARSLAAELKGYETSGKGTIRFPLDRPVPTALVKRLVKARVAEVRRKPEGGAR
jgi:uncharacterized protein YdhG (YjbR/CyaY superfamily)